MATILILEDNIELSLQWKILLESYEHHVQCTSNVDEAFALVEQLKPDLIIVDMLIRHGKQLQVEGGLTLITRLKLYTDFNRPILGVSGFTKGRYVQNTPLEVAKQLGISKAIYKPIAPETFLELVQDLLNPSES